MEEKELLTVLGMFGQIDKKLNEMNDRFERKFEEMDSKFEQKFEEMDNKFEELKVENRGLRQDLDDLRKEVKEIHEQQFVFEHEYGTKIDAIFDAVTMELDKNLEKSKKIRKLEERTERNEIILFDHEKRISKIELEN